MNSAFPSPALLLALACLLTFIAALAGGLLPALLRLTHTRLQLAVSFVAGLMLGLALLGLLPHASQELASAHRAARWLLAGFLVLFLLQRFFPFHHHDVTPNSPLEPCGHPHSLAERSARQLSWMGVAFGLSLHSIFDGVAMAAALASAERGHGTALGMGTALAVILHKPFGALAITTLMATSGASLRRQLAFTAAFGLVTPLGALLFFTGAGEFLHAHPGLLGAALAFCAGTFLCIACADLLPELQFHRHDRVALSVALLLGIVVAWAIVTVGHPEHHHHHHHQQPSGSLEAGGAATETRFGVMPT
jgi:zinc and cadmium transporter